MSKVMESNVVPRAVCSDGTSCTCARFHSHPCRTFHNGHDTFYLPSQLDIPEYETYDFDRQRPILLLLPRDEPPLVQDIIPKLLEQMVRHVECVVFDSIRNLLNGNGPAINCCAEHAMETVASAMDWRWSFYQELGLMRRYSFRRIRGARRVEEAEDVELFLLAGFVNQE